jgi:MFS family permease
MLFGFGFGGSAPPLAAMVSEFFGVRSVGLIMGLIGVGWAAGCAIGTVFSDYIFDIYGSYIMAFLGGGVVATIGAVFTLLLRAPKHQASLFNLGQKA